MNWLAVHFCPEEATFTPDSKLQDPGTPFLSGESHFLVNDIPHHLYWDKSFSSNSILAWIGTNKEQGRQPTNLKYMKFNCSLEAATSKP